MKERQPFPSPRPHPTLETERMAALHSYAVLDTPAEGAYDDIVKLAAQICAAGMAFITLVDDDRQWFKAKCGLDASETPRDIAFCAHAIMQEDEILLVEDSHLDSRFADNPLVTGPPFIRFYAGVPLRSSEGQAIGTLCVADRTPRGITARERFALITLARQVETQLELRRKLREVSVLGVELARQRDATIKVEQQKRDLVGLVVHDLKSPLTCVMAESEYVQERGNLSDEARECVASIKSNAERMHRLVLDMLDVSRSDDGEFQLRSSRIDIDAVIAEARYSATHRAAQSGSTISMVPLTEFSVLVADRELIRRVLENLLDNAIKYARGARIEVAARVDGQEMVVSVSDDGPGIASGDQQRIFEKYGQVARDAGDRSSSGLGLRFCKLAVEAHGGRIWIESGSKGGAQFCFALPLRRRGAATAQTPT